MKYTELLLVHGGLLGATYSTHQVSAPGVDLLRKRAFEPEERRLSLSSRSHSRSNSASTSPTRPAPRADTDSSQHSNGTRHDRFGSMDSVESSTSSLGSAADTINGTRYTSPMSTAHNSRSSTLISNKAMPRDTHDEEDTTNSERAVFDNRSLDLHFSPDLQRRDSPASMPSAMSAAMSGALDDEQPRTGRQEKRTSSLGFNMIRAWSGSANSSRENSRSRSRSTNLRTTSMK